MMIWLKVLHTDWTNRALDLDKIRARLESAQGPLYWKSLEELAETKEFQAFLDDELADRTPNWLDADHRRNFLKLAAASLAFAGITACTKQPKEVIVPYVRQPEEFVPGVPLYYATAMQMGGVGTGLLVTSHLGRPTKIEGNPDHPGQPGRFGLFPAGIYPDDVRSGPRAGRDEEGSHRLLGGVPGRGRGAARSGDDRTARAFAFSPKR